MDDAPVAQFPAQLDDWSLSGDNKQFERRFRCRNFSQTIAFVNTVVFIAHREDHHPNRHVGYKECNSLFTTHVIRGLARNDFIRAVHIDTLL